MWTLRDGSAQFPSYTGGSQPPYNTIISALNSDAASGTGTTVDSAPVTEMAQAVINSSPYTDQQLYQVMSSYYFWYKNTYQIFPVMPDPDIPAPSMWSVLKKYSVDGRIAMWQNIGRSSGRDLPGQPVVHLRVQGELPPRPVGLQ